jgi:hypothetical protein
MTEDIQRTLGSLEAKVDILLERTATASSDHDKLTSRVASLETHATITRNVAVGAGGFAAVLASLFGGYFNR